VEWGSFDDLRLRVESEWGKLPPTADVISPVIRAERAVAVARMRAA
jgi:hypothetical protein